MADNNIETGWRNITIIMKTEGRGTSVINKKIIQSEEWLPMYLIIYRHHPHADF